MYFGGPNVPKYVSCRVIRRRNGKRERPPVFSAGRVSAVSWLTFRALGDVSIFRYIYPLAIYCMFSLHCNMFNYLRPAREHFVFSLNKIERGNLKHTFIQTIAVGEEQWCAMANGRCVWLKSLNSCISVHSFVTFTYYNESENGGINIEDGRKWEDFRQAKNQQNDIFHRTTSSLHCFFRTAYSVVTQTHSTYYKYTLLKVFNCIDDCVVIKSNKGFQNNHCI